MKLTTLLSQKPFSQLKILAGHKGLHQEVNHVTMMDAPDIIPYLKSNDLLLTTGYHLKDQPEVFTELIKEMANLHCSAIFIKTERFLHTLPQCVLETADQMQFPIIELPEEWSLGDTMNQLLTIILDKRTSELRHAIDTHRQFTSHIMNGNGLVALMKHLTQLLNREVILTNPYISPIAGKSDLLDQLPYITELAQYGYLLLPHSTEVCFSDVQTQTDYTVYPVHKHTNQPDLLFVRGAISESDHVSRLIIEQAVNVLSFERLREEAIKQTTRRIRNEFFANFLDQSYTSDEEMTNKANEFDMPVDQEYICAVGEMDPQNEFWNYQSHHKELDQIYDFLENELQSLGVPCYLFTKGGQLILLIAVNDLTEDVQPFCASFLELLQLRLSRFYHLTLSFGVSHVCPSFLAVHQGYQEAQKAFQPASGWRQPSSIYFYQTTDISGLLRLIPEKELSSYYDQTFKQLKLDQLDEDKTLLHTLFMYMECQCQISETAKQLFVHRNTVVYRLEKCEELLRTSLKDPEFTLQIRTAMRIRQIIEG
ncbi:PucR family transcriptional regulator [Alkalicoccobacillus porphyridii]|uniref:PucR family transcriptional regulator n=1 Tax=Alkalicoccobacillus porphyridii TaxID=2597270 RepID=A0A554A3Q3_9BACI|nr:PucR family transcriptional regulator [Alkalicoccobacillus porphyridii]TSB48319.1 PucR family transcriptional regulator [Alkalicoccobacillus porphyridii]